MRTFSQRLFVFWIVRRAAIEAAPVVASNVAEKRATIPREELAERTRDLLPAAETEGPAQRQQILDEVVTSHLWLAEKPARRFTSLMQLDDDERQVIWLRFYERLAGYVTGASWVVDGGMLQMGPHAGSHLTSDNWRKA